MKKRAIISVSDKTGIVDFAKGLVELGFEIISTGGTRKILQENNISTINISDITSFPECLDGRVKTMHPNIHAGVLAIRSNKNHMDQLKEHNINTIDLVCINLYPFKDTIRKKDVQLEDAIENIDIGGPTLLRAAAKNYQDVIVVIDNKDYELIIKKLNEGGVSKEEKFVFASKVFEHTAHYDAIISSYLFDKTKEINKSNVTSQYQDTVTLTYEKVQDLRYGENPHQTACFYKESISDAVCLSDAKQLHGKELSFNNINDANGAIEIVKEFDDPTVVAVKHANPCGVGSADTIIQAYKKAYDSDPVSIFGGIIATNKEVCKETAEEINKIFVEIVIAPSYSKEALEVLTAKKNIRVLKLEGLSNNKKSKGYDMKKVFGGMLIQDYNNELYDNEQLKVVTNNKPTDEQLKDMEFAMKVVKHTKSNGIVLVKNKQTIGIGPGQTNRVTALRIAIDYAKEKCNGAVLASDAFFPFEDCVEEANNASIKAIIQPGGSIRDNDSIKACDKYNITMVFTGKRHFKH